MRSLEVPDRSHRSQVLVVCVLLGDVEIRPCNFDLVQTLDTNAYTHKNADTCQVASCARMEDELQRIVAKRKTAYNQLRIKGDIGQMKQNLDRKCTHLGEDLGGLFGAGDDDGMGRGT